MRLYQSSVNAFDRNASTFVAAGDEPEFWLNGVQQTNDGALQFSPALNDRGDYAYGVALENIKGSWYSNSIILNGQVLQPANNRVHHKLTMDDNTLAWISTNPAIHNDHQLHVYDLTTGAKTVVPLSFFPDNVLISNGTVHVSGLSVSQQQTVVHTFNAATSQLVPLASGASVMLVDIGDTPFLMDVQGTGGMASLFYAMHRLLGPQAHEPFAIGNDYAGRQAWNVSYRLDALVNLHEITQDTRIRDSFQSAVSDMLGQATSDGLFQTLRYSVGTDFADFAGHSGIIFANALRGINMLDAATAQLLLDKAIAAYDHYESDWLGYYRNTPHQDYVEDGAPMAFNLAHAMGMMVVELYRQTGDQRYLDRIQDMWDNFTSEFKTASGITVWDYYPQSYYDGWALGEVESTHMPTKPPTSPVVHIDTAHMKLDVSFLIGAAEVLGLPLPFDMNALGDQLETSPFIFQRYMGANQTGWFEYVPVLPTAAAIKPYFERYLPQWFNDMDGQSFLPGYAEAAMLNVSGASPITITLTNLDNSNQSSVTFTTAQQVIDYWYGVLDTEAPITPHTNGTDASDSMAGTGLDDYLLGMAGHDTLIGGAGNDWLFGETGNDTLFGGDGLDKLSGNDGDDTLYGGSENDDLRGQNGDDYLYGDEGQDSLSGGPGADKLYGGIDSDKLYGNRGEDTLEGGAGGDILNGGEDTDTASYAGADAAVRASLGNGERIGDAVGDIFISIENLTGSAWNDQLIGDNAANQLSGGDGDDVLVAMGGDDVLSGGRGNDTLDGGTGRNQYFGGEGFDTVSFLSQVTGLQLDMLAINPTTGALLQAFDSIERIFGSNSADTIHATELANQVRGMIGNDTIYGRGGDDQLSGDAGDDVLDGGSGNDNLSGDAGNDTLLGGLGSDILNGGSGTDTASYANAAAAVSVSLQSSLRAGEATGDILISIENITGSGWDDLLMGDDTVNVIVGGSGNDTIFDFGGNDTVQGEGGDDTFHGGSGTNHYFGGSGFDTLGFFTKTSAILLDMKETLSNTGFVIGTFNSVERVFGSEHSDVIRATDVGDQLRGLGGDDALLGRGGDDIIAGDAGNDTLDGGIGNDLLYGDAGSDTFVFASLAGHDVIADFDGDSAGGQDFVDLRALGVNSGNFGAMVTSGFVTVQAVTGGTLLSVNHADGLVRVTFSGLSSTMLDATDFLV
jgi:Ca2+-binding RTX toxin-like protein